MEPRQETDIFHDPPHNETKPFIVIDDNSRNPKIWLTIHSSCPDDPESAMTLYKETNILNKAGWLFDSEIHAGQVLLKREFPMVDGLHDPAVTGPLVVPAISEFIQIIKCWETLGVFEFRWGTPWCC